MAAVRVPAVVSGPKEQPTQSLALVKVVKVPGVQVFEQATKGDALVLPESQYPQYLKDWCRNLSVAASELYLPAVQ